MEYLMNSINKYLDITPVAKFLDSHRVLTACATAGILYGAWYLKRPRNLPPGPWGYPIVGSMLSLSNEPDMGMTELRKKYGDVCCLWLGGNRYWVIFSGYETIKEAYITRGADFMDRDTDELMLFFGLEDTILFAHYDETYKASRKVAAQGLRTLLSTKLQIILGENMDQVEAALKPSLGQAVDLSLYIKSTLANCMLELLVGTNYKHDDTDFVKLRDDLECWALHLFDTFGIFVSPKIIRKIFFSKSLETIKQEMTELRNLMEKYVDDHIARGNGSDVKDLIDVYLQSKGPIAFSKLKIASTMLLFLPDTMMTSSEMMLWVLVYLVNYPECQEQILQEIQNVCGSAGVSLKKRPEMPITESFIMEVFRFVNPLVFGMFGKPAKTTTFRGYNIPETATILVHYGGVHKDPVYFPEPETFKPERFVKDEKIGNTVGFIPFGMGRRMCMGEQFVRSMIFYMTARLVSQYQISSPDGNKLSTEPQSDSFFPKPAQFSVVLKNR